MSPRTSSVPNEVLERYQRLQVEMAGQVIVQPLRTEPRTIAAIDVHMAGDRGIASVVAVRYPGLDVVEERVSIQDITFPYVPGFLSFREAPICLAAIDSLTEAPGLILVDGQGMAHPRRFGVACHIGVETGLPAIGVAKSILVGRHHSLAADRGSTAELVHRGEIVGMAVRTRAGVTPVYVSIGHLITLEDAVRWTLNCTTRYRLPEPSRLAHRLASEAAKDLRSS